jgi:hypothetical protein
MNDKNESIEAVKAGLYEVPEVMIDDMDNLYRNWLDAGRQQLAAFDKYLASLRFGVDTVAKKAMALAAENANASLGFARALMRAKDANEILNLQLEFYQKQSAVFAAQLQELSRTVIKAAERAS